MKTVSYKRIFASLLGLVLVSSVTLGFFGLREKGSEDCRLLQESASYPAASSVNINRSLSGETEPSSGEEEGRQSEEDLLYMLRGVNTVSSNAVIVILTSIFIFCITIPYLAYKDKINSFNARLRYYSNWRLKFLTPLQKVILNRSGEYDINRIREIFGEKNPRFVFEQNAGFFYSS